MIRFLARDVIYTSRAYAMMPVSLSVCLLAMLLAAWPLAVLLAGGSSRAMLASARLSCYLTKSVNALYEV